MALVVLQHVWCPAHLRMFFLIIFTLNLNDTGSPFPIVFSSENMRCARRISLDFDDDETLEPSWNSIWTVAEAS